MNLPDVEETILIGSGLYEKVLRIELGKSWKKRNFMKIHCKLVSMMYEPNSLEVISLFRWHGFHHYSGSAKRCDTKIFRSAEIFFTENDDFLLGMHALFA